jgi:hypothetical protein
LEEYVFNLSNLDFTKEDRKLLVLMSRNNGNSVNFYLTHLNKTVIGNRTVKEKIELVERLKSVFYSRDGKGALIFKGDITLIAGDRDLVVEELDNEFIEFFIAAFNGSLIIRYCEGLKNIDFNRVNKAQSELYPNRTF